MAYEPQKRIQSIKNTEQRENTLIILYVTLLL